MIGSAIKHEVHHRNLSTFCRANETAIVVRCTLIEQKLHNIQVSALCSRAHPEMQVGSAFLKHEPHDADVPTFCRALQSPIPRSGSTVDQEPNSGHDSATSRKVETVLQVLLCCVVEEDYTNGIDVPRQTCVQPGGSGR